MAELVVERLSPERADDFLAFFDGPAFADNPEWASCYCHFHEVPTAIDWPSLDREANRTAVLARIAVGEKDGFLAYAHGRVVGWLSAQSRHRLPHCFARMRVPPTPIDCADFEAASVVCFVIDPAWRRQGVARTLLRAACASFAARGYRLVEGYPFKAPGGALPAAHYHGPLSLFLGEGFTAFRDDAGLTVVRKALATA